MVRSRDDVIDSCHLTIYYHQVAHPEDRARETKGGLYGAVSPAVVQGAEPPVGSLGAKPPPETAFRVMVKVFSWTPKRKSYCIMYNLTS